ncbi:B12-binding domain-containing radical SAM protein [Microcoleus sp. BROC3]|uniref:B12-binding domain-containing radical SAM protein n=1 Tax=Microcoleus sp. BROC3 TaxID=3055323 RepID=UPI002FD08239
MTVASPSLVSTIAPHQEEDNHLIPVFQSFLNTLAFSNPKQLIFINPQLVPEDVFDIATARNRGYYAYPPIGLMHLAAIAREVNPQIDVQVIDLNYEILRAAQSNEFSYQRTWQEILLNNIHPENNPYVVITCMFGSTMPIFVDIVRFIQENFPNLPILSGGVQASYDYKELLTKKLCNILFRKEGETQFKAFMESCLTGKAVSLPWGAAFELGGQVYELGTPGPGVEDWDRDIRPYYDLLDIQNYHKYGSLAAFSRYNGEEKSFATVLSNRGCRAQCTFCTVRDFNGQGVRQRSVESVIEEIKFLVREKGIKQIDWLDDDLLFNADRSLELFKRLAEEVPELEWVCNNGLIAVAVTEEIMYWMVKSGLKAFKVGIETGNDEMLKLVKKPTTKPALLKKSKLFKKYPEVFLSGNFIIGFPNETFGQMMDTYNFARELNWDWASIYICQPLKGTEMFSAFQELGDDGCEVENYDKTLNPGRSSKRGEFGVLAGQGTSHILTGKDIFNFPYDSVPSREQLKEIWFTFNFVANFLDNPNFAPGGNPAKIVRWFESIHWGYPYDASMCAGLVKGYKLLGNQEKMSFYQHKFLSIVSESSYWQRRIQEFPEMLEFAEVDLPGQNRERTVA